MTLTLHRISKFKYAGLPELNDHGYGAARFGSRWNSPDPELRHDRRIIYASDTLALAMLEVIVHVGSAGLSSAAHGHVLLEVGERSVLQLEAAELKAGWNAHPETALTQVIGDQWYDECASAVLRLPSAVLPQEDYRPGHCNDLINARHPEITSAVRLLTHRPLRFGIPGYRTASPAGAGQAQPGRLRAGLRASRGGRSKGNGTSRSDQNG